MNKSEFVEAIKRRIKPIAIEGMENTYIRSLSGLMRARVADAYRSMEGQTIEAMFIRVQCDVVAHVLVNESGERMFGDGDIDAIAELDAEILDQISQAGLAASGMGPQATEQAEKNSETIPSESSSTT